MDGQSEFQTRRHHQQSKSPASNYGRAGLLLNTAQVGLVSLMQEALTFVFGFCYLVPLLLQKVFNVAIAGLI
jgi:hypothetical protein